MNETNEPSTESRLGSSLSRDQVEWPRRGAGSGGRIRRPGPGSRAEGIEVVPIRGVQRNQRDDATDRSPVQHVDEIDGREPPAVDESRRYEGVAGTADVAEKERQRGHPQDSRPQEQRGPEPCARFPEVGDRDHPRQQSDAEHDHARGIHPLNLPALAGRVPRNEPQAQDYQQQADRNVDQEDATPGPVGHEQSAEDRPGHGADRENAAEQPHGLVAAATEVVGHDAGRRGGEAGATRRLYGAQHDQQVDVVGQATAEGGPREDRYRSEEEAPASVATAQLAGHREHQDHAERVAGDRPARPVDRGVEPVLDRVQRGRDDRLIQRTHHQREGDGREDDQAPCERRLLLGPWDIRSDGHVLGFRSAPGLGRGEGPS